MIAQGGAFGGWVLYAIGAGPSLSTTSWVSTVRDRGHAADPGGEHQVRMEFAYDGGGLAKGGGVTLFYDGKRWAKEGWR